MGTARRSRWSGPSGAARDLMPLRTRLLRPGFFENEDLAALPPYARLLFAGLWLLADRAGRVEDRPVRIKAAIFPYEDVEVDPLLDALAASGFITRYTVAGYRGVSIVKFLAHQMPHVREAPSTLPAPDPDDLAKTLSQNEKPGKGSAKAMPRPCLGSAGALPRSSVSVSVFDPVSDPVPVTGSGSGPDAVPELGSGSGPVSVPASPSSFESPAQIAPSFPSFQTLANMAAARRKPHGGNR
jgi:hypothetical protein